MGETLSLIQPGARLPRLRLEAADGKVEVLDAPERGSPALLFVRDKALEVARPYIATWERVLSDLTSWYGRPLLITESATGETRIPSASATADDWLQLGIAEHAYALIIADRWGVVYFAQETTNFGDLPSAAEVEQWLRYLATQCPECGVIDEPGYGEWAP
jgi:hypothetical protein